MILIIETITNLSLPFFLFGQYEQSIVEKVKIPIVAGDSIASYSEYTPVKTTTFFTLEKEKYEYTLETKMEFFYLYFLYYSSVPKGWAQKLYVLISQVNKTQQIQTVLDSNIMALSDSIFIYDNYDNDLKHILLDNNRINYDSARSEKIYNISLKLSNWLSQIDNMTDSQLEYILMDFDLKLINIPLWSFYLVALRKTPNILYAKAAIEYADRVSAYLSKKKWHFEVKDIDEITHKCVVLAGAIPTSQKCLSDTAICDNIIKNQYNEITDRQGEKTIVSGDDKQCVRIIKARYQKFGKDFIESLNELKELVYINSGYVFKISP